MSGGESVGSSRKKKKKKLENKKQKLSQVQNSDKVEIQKKKKKKLEKKKTEIVTNAGRKTGSRHE